MGQPSVGRPSLCPHQRLLGHVPFRCSHEPTELIFLDRLGGPSPQPEVDTGMDTYRHEPSKRERWVSIASDRAKDNNRIVVTCCLWKNFLIQHPRYPSCDKYSLCSNATGCGENLVFIL